LASQDKQMTAGEKSPAVLCLEVKKGDDVTENVQYVHFAEQAIARRVGSWDFKITKGTPTPKRLRSAGEYCRAKKTGREP